MTIKLSKEYLEQHYKLAVSNYQLAHNEEEQWQARSIMANLEHCASEMYGFDYADTLAKLKEPLIKGE